MNKREIINTRLLQYIYLCRLHKPIGILLLLWPTLWALWIAGEGHPETKIVLLFVLGTILMRSAGCAINDFIDRKFDPYVTRTQQRPLATNAIKPYEAISVFVVLSLCALILVLSLNQLTQYLALAAIALTGLYPLAKRYTYLPQVVLGIAFAWAIPMAFAAQTNSLPKVAWLLFVIATLWTIAYDTIYAMIDRSDDLRIGIKSTAILLGDADVPVVLLLYAMVLLGLWLLGKQLQFGWTYYLGWTAAMLFTLYQYWLIRQRDPTRCLQAFRHSHYFGLFIFLGILLQYRFA